MKALLPISGLLIALLGPVGSGYAQYLFLDTNGDSSSTTMDGLSTLVPTEIDVWICTNANRDGSKAIAATRSEVPLSIFSYEFILHATGGTIEWMKYTNLQPGMDFNAGERESDTDFYTGFEGGQPLAPGRHKLGTFADSHQVWDPKA